MITVIDTFFVASGDQYAIRYNDFTGAITVLILHTGAGSATELATVSESERGYSEGDPLPGSVCKSDSTYTKVTFNASLTNPFATIAAEEPGAAECGAPTSGGSCDLSITGVTTTNESAAGAADGTLTVTAATTNGPVSYSLNNAIWQSSNVFTGLSAGSGTVYTKDALLCTAMHSYIVALTATPPAPGNRLVSTPAQGQSRWSALFNPIVFGYQSNSHVPGRKFITKITSGYDGASNVITATHAANLTGYCRADISKYLRTLLIPKDELDYTAINYRDANISASYTVEYKEVWDDGEDADWTSAGDPFYVTYSAMQIGNPTGGNMAPFVTYPTVGQLNPAKFLNDFKEPVLYPNMPWDISFIYSEKIAGYQIKLGGNGIDVNGGITGVIGEAMLLNEDGSVLLNEDGSKLLIEQQAPGVLYNKLGVNRLRITQNIPALSEYLEVFLFYVSGSNDVVITERKRLRVDWSPCPGLPYEYLKWIGPSGGWLYYMFQRNQIHEINTDSAMIVENFIADYATVNSSQQLISIDAQKRITLGKNDVPAQEAEVLSTLLYSPKVYRLVDAVTNTWQGVVVDTRSLKMYQTWGGSGDFEISIKLPSINTQAV